MPTVSRLPAFDIEEFKWAVEGATNFHGLLGTSTLTSAIAAAIAQTAAATTPTQIAEARAAMNLALSQLTIPIALLNENLEGTATGYTRVVCTPTPGSLIYSWDTALGSYKTNETSFTKTIPTGQTWDYQWVIYIRNAATWGNRAISSVDATANTITFPANSATFATGDRVVITADTGGTLPGGLTQDPGSTRASVVMELLSPTGTTTITSQLRPLGGGSAIDLSAGSGTLRVRAANGQFYAIRIEDSQQAASGEITLKLTHFKRPFSAV